MRGLIVREPYASMIVEGKKNWEIRRWKTRVRGEVYIISGGKLVGKVELVDVLGPFTVDELEAHFDKHRAGRDFLEAYSRGSKLYAWVFRNPVKFEKPVKVSIPRGVRVWVRIEGMDKS